MRQDLHELAEVDSRVVIALREEGVHDPVAQRIDGQLGDAQKVLTAQGAAVAAVQGRESGVEALDLVGSDWGWEAEIRVGQWCVSECVYGYVDTG